MIFRYVKPLLLLAILLAYSFTINAQIKEKEQAIINIKIDTIELKGIDPEIIEEYSRINISREDAITFLQHRSRSEYWLNRRDPLRLYISQLLYYASNDREVDVANYLKEYPYDSILVPEHRFYVWDTIRIVLPVGHNRDSVALDIMEKALAGADSTAVGGRYDRSRLIESIGQDILIQGDTMLLVLVDTLKAVTPGTEIFPFRGYDHPLIGDSIQASINELIGYLEQRDSSKLFLTGSSSVETPFWINAPAKGLVRFWLRNEYDDSVTVWVGNPDRNTIGLYLENNIMFRRPVKASNIVEAKVNIPSVDNRTLREVQTIYVKPNYWRYTSEVSFVLNQAYLSNWVKGGESNISSVADLTVSANYLNTPQNFLWYNQGRLKHGFISSLDKGIRRNVDLIELSSKLNHKAFGKFDFSGTALFKTQLAKGYNYPKDKEPELVSRIMSPATVTIGFGLDYKPNKQTSFNFAPISYKGTYVADTVLIDQKKYGIPLDRKARHEPGASLLVNHKFSPFKDITVSNKVRLFTNYIQNPQNIDIDWELIATASLNWFTDVRLNTHFIFDDDTKTTLYDESGEAVLDGDGNPKKTARIQFKEIIGFSFIFRF